jgi:hypothetical protein
MKVDNPNILLTELREISPVLAEIKNENIFSVPPTYFNNLAEDIIQNINSVYELVNNFSSVTPYKVEESYFDNLSNSILQKIRNQQRKSNEVIDELNSIAPLLNTISKAPLFSVSKQYFENFHVSEKNLIKPKEKFFIKQFTRYAVAAVIASLMAVGVYVITGKVDKRSGAQAVNVKSAVKNLRDEEIIEFLRSHSSVSNTRNGSSQKNSPASKFYETLKQMTDKEIQQYLQENVEPGEIEVDI